MNSAPLAKPFTVFELINDRLREIYVASTDGPVFGVFESFKKRRAPAIAHWNFHDVRQPRSVEFGLSQEEARTFIDGYVHNAIPEGWKYLI